MTEGETDSTKVDIASVKTYVTDDEGFVVEMMGPVQEAQSVEETHDGATAVVYQAGGDQDPEKEEIDPRVGETF